jgi:outer membrane protein assembly factor BamB
MVRDPRLALYVGIGHFVVALDAATGAELWRSKLKNTGFVSVLWDGEALVAASAGEVYRLDPRTGDVLWHNEMKGLGMGVVTLASERLPNANGQVEPARSAAVSGSAASA